MKVRYGTIATDKKSTPNSRADLEQQYMELIDLDVDCWFRRGWFRHSIAAEMIVADVEPILDPMMDLSSPQPLRAPGFEWPPRTPYHDQVRMATPSGGIVSVSPHDSPEIRSYTGAGRSTSTGTELWLRTKV